MQRNIYCTAILLILSVTLIGVLDCKQGTQGSLGNLLFFDLTRVPEDPLGLDQEPNRAIAVGADIEIAVRDNRRVEMTVTDASSNDESVFQVSNTLRNVVQIQASSPGSAILEVDAGGLSDNIALSVSAIASSRLEILPWGESKLLPESVYAGGVAMVPGSNTSLFLRHLDAQGRILSGYGAKTLTVEPSGARLTPTLGSDFYTLRAMDTVETITLTTDDLSEEIEVLELESVTSVTLNDVNNNGLVVPSNFSVTDGARLYTLGAYTDDGRYVIAPFDDTFEVEIEEGSELYMEYVEMTSSEGQDLLDDARAFFLDFASPGTANFTVRWLDFELPFTVLIEWEEVD